MKVTIKNLTDMTITFNKVGIILRGHCDNPEYAMSNTAKNVELATKEQENEVKALEQRGIIAVIRQEEPKPKVEEFKISPPKVVENKSKSKKIKKISEREKEIEKDYQDNKVTVMTDNGPVTAKMFNTLKASEDADNPSGIKASLEAMEKLEDEEKTKDVPLDNNKLNVEDKTGNEVVLSMGNNVFKKVAMKKSMIDGQDTISNTPFIDPNPTDVLGKENKKQVIVQDNNDDDDSKSDAFIEI